MRKIYINENNKIAKQYKAKYREYFSKTGSYNSRKSYLLVDSNEVPIVLMMKIKNYDGYIDIEL